MYGGSHSGPLPSDFEENQKREEPRRFKKGDKVRVNNSWEDVDEYLQENNRVGAIIYLDPDGYCWLHMDKPIIKEYDAGANAAERPSIISDSHAYYAMNTEIELLESVSEFQKPFDIEAWRKNLKPGDKVRVVENPRIFDDSPKFVEPMDKWKGCVVTLKEKNSINSNWWRIEEEGFWWDRRRFEPVEKVELSESTPLESPSGDLTGQGESRKQPLESRLKKLIQTALELIQTIEETFRKTKEYPIFGMNLKQQEPEVKTQRLSLGESLYSLGVVLYHLYAGESEHNNPSYLLDNYPKPKDMPEEFWEVVDKLLKSEYRNLKEFKEDLKKWKEVLKQNNKDSP